MAKTFYVSPGRSYTVTASEGTTITYPGIIKPAATVGSEGSVTFNCTGTEIVVSDDSAQIAQNFNNAGAAVAGAGGGSGSLDGVALLEGGNSFSGDQTITGDVTIDGAVTISGDVTAEGEYNGAEVIETQDTTIIPEAGKYYKYTGTGDAITVAAPIWNGYMTISYLETAEPVELEGVTWSPAKPSLTGAGPFVYTLVCAESGNVLASAMNYSVATAEAIKEVVPIDCTNDSVTLGTGASSNGKTLAVVIGKGAATTQGNAVIIGALATSTIWNTTHCVVIGYGAKATNGGSSVVVGQGATAAAANSVALGVASQTQGGAAVALGFNAKASGTYSEALGHASQAAATYSAAIGMGAKAADYGAVVLRSTASDGTITQLYFSGANTPLAIQYENGEAMMGYVVTDSNGNVLTDAEGNAMIGTQKLSVLFPNNRGANAFTPAALNLDDEWTPKPMFRPSDLDLPDIEPTEPEIEGPSEEL